MAVLSYLVDNWGFVVGAVLKYGHSLVFHCYQHRWWSAVPLRRQGRTPPVRGRGLATARYHAHHHAAPDDAIFAYAES